MGDTGFGSAEAASDPTDGAPVSQDGPPKPAGDAPFGYLADGVTPRKSRAGRPRGSSKKSAGSRPGGPTAPPRAPKASTSRSKTDYTDGITGMVHMAAMPLLAVSPLDAAALLNSANDIAHAVNITAQNRPEVAAMCEKIMTAGPYGLLIGALLKPVAQICENHGWLPAQVTRPLGAVPREDLADMLRQQYAEQRPAPEQPQANAYA